MQLSVYQINKRSSYEFKNIQDRYAFNLTNNVFALADGTTQSFNSEIWAKQICDSFASNEPNFNPADFIKASTQNAELFKAIKYELSTNPAKASLERDKSKKGATSTFIGIQIDSNDYLNVISVGDCNIFIKRGDSILKYPFNTLEELDSNNFFLNTESLLAKEVDDSFFYTKKIQLQKNDIIILATDALSRYFINDITRIKTFLSLKNFNDFHDYCVSNWENKILEEDDITGVVILNNLSQSNVKEYLPPNNFSFPREKELEFIPTSFDENNTKNQINNFDMQQINNYLNAISKEISILKKKTALNQILLFCLIGLSVINLFVLISFNLGNNQSNAIEHKQSSEEIFNQEQKIDNNLIEFNDSNYLKISDTVSSNK